MVTSFGDTGRPNVAQRPNRQERRRQQRLARRGGHASTTAITVDIPATLARAVQDHRAGRPDRALIQYDQILAARPEHLDALKFAALASEAVGDGWRSLDYLGRAVTAAGTDPELAFHYGNALDAAGRHDEAVAAYEQALAARPAWDAAHFNLGCALEALGRRESAQRAYEAAISANPALGEAYCNLGNVLIDQGDAAGAFAAWEAGAEHLRGPGAEMSHRPDMFRHTNASKLRHDIEQYRYLMARGLLDEKFDQVVADYEAALAVLPTPPPGQPTIEIPAKDRTKLAPYHNRLIHRGSAPTIPSGAVAARADRAEIEADYAAHAPGITAIDDLLTTAALDSLRSYCLESTIWFQAGYANGYIGALVEEGLSCPLLLQIAEELRAALPGIFKDYPLTKAWAFKHDSRMTGLNLHADSAAINCNFWLTPDDALLDPESSGLILWDKEAPPDWSFDDFNANEPAMRTFLAESGAKPVEFNYGQNRAVVFNSDLFHETGALQFKDGYENRRINVTLLYGRRQGQID